MHFRVQLPEGVLKNNVSGKTQNISCKTFLVFFLPETYLETCQTSKIKLFAKMNLSAVNHFPIEVHLNVSQGLEINELGFVN